MKFLFSRSHFLFGTFCLTSLLIISSVSHAEDYSDDLRKNDSLWMNWHLYHGVDQRGGPFKFKDTYLEAEFGGRSGFLHMYGYVDFLDILHDSSSDKYKGDNYFAKIIPRFSLDGIFQEDLAIGPFKEWYLSSTLIMADGDKVVTAKENNKDIVISKNGGLQVIWLGIGTDIELPWLGLTGMDLYARYISDNYGASNEKSWDGYVFHLNWFKPFWHLEDGLFVAFQGYIDYEFGSKLPDDNNAFEKKYRTSDSFQSYLGFWLHGEHWALGYGAKLYSNMTQWKNDVSGDGLGQPGKKTDTTGIGHYFNIAYKF